MTDWILLAQCDNVFTSSNQIYDSDNEEIFWSLTTNQQVQKSLLVLEVY